MNILFPNMTVQSFQTLDLNRLKEQGIQVLFIDVDNTITTENNNAISKEAYQFILDVKNIGIEPVIFSNNFKFHVDRVLKGYPDVALCTFVCKPLPFSYLWQMVKRKIRPSHCAMLGDQLFTDILGGNLACTFTILTKPLTKVERNDTKIMRCLENLVYTRWEKQGKIARKDDYVRIL